MSDVMDQFAANRLEFEAVSISCVLPSDITLVGGDTPISTQGATRVELTLTEQKLNLSVSPGLIVHTPWIWPPCPNIIIWGLDHWFPGDSGGSCSEQPNIVVLTGYASGYGLYDPRGIVIGKVRDWWNDMIRGTRLGDPGYNPLHDLDPSGLVQQILTKVSSSGGAGMPDLTGLGGMLEVKTLETISEAAGDGGVEIPGGTDLKFYVSLSGTAADVKAGKVQVSSVGISTDGIYISQQGERIMRITQLTVSRGCTVRIDNGEILSEKIKKLNALADGVVDFFLILAIAASGMSEDEVRLRSAAGTLNVSASDLRAAQNVIQSRLTDALRQLYQQNYAALQGKIPGGVNLDDVFGAECRKAP